VLEGAVMTFWPRCRTCGWRGGTFDITQVGREAYELLALLILAVLPVGMLR
jgi:hypothetical protein